MESFANAGGMLFLLNEFCQSFDPSFLGIRSVRKLESFPAELTYPDVEQDLEPIQDIIRDYETLYREFPAFEELREMDYGYGFITDTASTLASGGGFRTKPGWNLSPFLLLFDTTILLRVSVPLTLFYFTYVCLSFILLMLLSRLTRYKRFFFVLFCVLDISPFLFVRLLAFRENMALPFVLVGFSYNMLKAVDAVYYVYYTEENIPPLLYANYLLFFPVMTGGPIFRYRDFKRLYKSPKHPDLQTVKDSAKRLILGLFKKLVLLALLQEMIALLLTGGQHFYISILMIVCSYALIWLDFSGYSDIAIAVGSMTGIRPPENFNHPLSSASFTQFWRRWHITLSDWIREHIFVVMNGKRLTKYQSAFIGMGTMLVMGLWHGFSKADLLRGAYLGAFLMIENLFGWSTFDKRKKSKIVYYARCLMVAFLFGVNAMMFHLNFDQTVFMLKGLFRP